MTPAHAQVLDTGTAEFGQAAGYGEASLPAVIGRIVKIILSILGLAAVIIIIAGGVVWMTSGGNPEKIDRAKKILSSGVIGLLIIISAYAIASFIVEQFTGVTGPEFGLGPREPGPGGFLPADVFKIRRIETAHGGLAQNYNSDVYLCSAVQPVFNHSVAASVIVGLAAGGSLRIESDGNAFSGNWQTRNNAVIFKHSDLFNENTSYLSYFPKDIIDTGGSLLQTCIAAGGCLETANYFIWNFSTGVDTDDILPAITSTTPTFDTKTQNYPDRNVSRKPVIRVTFSEPIDITTIVDGNNKLIDSNIWVAKLDGEGGDIIETLDKAQWDADITSNGFTLSLVNDENNYLLEPFIWYRIHVGNIEDLCSNKMASAVEWEFQTNDKVPGVESWNPTGNRSCPDTNISIVFATTMWDYKVQMAVTGPNFGQDFTFDMRPSELTAPYQKEIWNGPVKVGVLSVVDTFEGSNNFRVFSFDPEINLADNSEYSIDIKTDLVVDRDGTLLSHNWSFTTATLETCLCAPWIAYIDPDEGGPGQCATIHGSCFEGTFNQSAAPSSLSFILGEELSDATIAGYDKNYITTTIPTTYSDGDRPKAGVTITYNELQEELTSNTSEFFINSDDAATGPCLYSMNPSGGYPNITKVDLAGDRFGNDPYSQVTFYPEQTALYASWSDTKIEDALVPEGAQTGNVVVINDQGISNALPFTVYERTPPKIISISPDQGTNNPAIPTYVTITGENFGLIQGKRSVMIGNYEADTTCYWTDVKIIAIVPGELDIGQSYEVKITDPETGESNAEQFSVNNTFHPAICKLDPNYGKKDDRISVIGTNFGDSRGNSYSNFDTIQMSDIDASDWSNTRITISVPEIINVESDVTVHVPSPIETNNPFKSSNPAPFYKEPKITSISPDKGPQKTWVTIRGENFLSSPGTVYFKYNGQDYAAVSLPDYCGSTWTDTKILVEVPQNLPQASGLLGSYGTKAYVKTIANIDSNKLEFKVNNNPLGPALCYINPDSGSPGDSGVVVKGKRFNFDPDDLNDFKRQLIFNKDQTADTLTWTSDTEVNAITVPSGAMSGKVVVTKEVIANCRVACDAFAFGNTCFGNWVELCDRVWTTSNPLYFDMAVVSGATPRVVEDISCLNNIQGPSPWKESEGVCINTGIAARFNTDMKDETLVSDNIIIEKCNMGVVLDTDQCSGSISGNIFIVNHNTDNEGFIFYPLSYLDTGTWHQITLTTEINGSGGISLPDQYQWHFRTSESFELCQVDNVNVLPAAKTLRAVSPEMGSTQDYTAFAQAAQCYIISNAQIISDLSQGVGSNTTINDDGLAIDLKDLSTPYLWVANSNLDKVSRIRTSDGVVEGTYDVGDNPSRTAVDIDGNVWIANRNSDNVTKLDIAGNLIGTYSVGGGPRGLAIDIEGNAWIANHSDSNVMKLDGATGNVLATYSVGGGPYGAAVDARGNVWTANRGGQSVSKIDIDTGIVITYPGVGASGCEPYGIAIDLDDNVWVADTCSGVYKITQNGEVTHYSFTGMADSRGRSRGVAMDKDGYIWLAFDFSGQVLKLDTDGNKIGIYNVGNFPIGITGDAEGYIWAVNHNGSGSGNTCALSGGTVTKLRASDGNLIGTYCISDIDGAEPYTYSDMAGFALRSITLGSGIWRYDFDSGQPGNRWDYLSWNTEEPEGTNIKVRVRSAADQAGLASAAWSNYFAESSVNLGSIIPDNQWLQIEVVLRTMDAFITPYLKNMTVASNIWTWSSSDVGKAIVIENQGQTTTATALAETVPGPPVKITAEIVGLDKSGYGELIIDFSAPTEPFDLPYIVEERTCKISNQSPSPWKDFVNTCINAGISARFSENVNGLDLNNIIVEKCNSGTNFDDSGGCNVVNGSIQTFANSFIFTPTSNLSSNYWYRVTLRSDGIVDTDGYQLDGNRNTKQDSTPLDDYIWQFRTKNDTTSCSAESVLVNEQVPTGEVAGILVKNNTRDYNASAIGADCQILVRGNDWSWSSSNTSIAAVSGSSTNSETVTAVEVGETKIQATATPVGGGESQADDKDLIVTIKSGVVRTYPNDGDTNICRNSFIAVYFSQAMKIGALSSDTITVSDQDGTIPINISVLGGNTVVSLHAGLLDESTQYSIVIKGGSNGVKNIYDIAMDTDYSFNFKTGNEICQLTTVVIDPDSVILDKAGNTVGLIAHPQDQNDSTIVGSPGQYDWDWSWTSSDNTVATITNSTTSNETAAAQNNNGFSTIKATATIIDDFRPDVSTTEGRIYSGSSRIQVFLCENPLRYRDEITHQEFFYCRDDQEQSYNNPGYEDVFLYPDNATADQYCIIQGYSFSKSFSEKDESDIYKKYNSSTETWIEISSNSRIEEVVCEKLLPSLPAPPFQP
ncbi:Ig-like domain-containing protein [Patescibacteria group bacterium AH-259-L07]|nr:Ig-like domain-containing protein [Patescibacteria group bacterium AH-259-L07]